MDNSKMLTLEEIQDMSGHDTIDGVRMALRRGGVKTTSVVFGFDKEGWPPKKAYRADDVWRVLGDRIAENSKGNPGVKEAMREAFIKQIEDAELGRDVIDALSDEKDEGTVTVSAAWYRKACAALGEEVRNG